MKTFAASLLAANAFAATGWWMDNVQFNAISQNSSSRYWMKGMYGPNNMGWFGQYAYIYLEIGGAEIADGAVVTTYASIVEADLPVYEWQTDAWGNMT